MSRIYILGIGMTALGKFPERSVKNLTAEAVSLALNDAAIAPAALESAWFSNTRQGLLEGQNGIRGQIALRACGIEGIPIANVENACASASSAVQQAFAHLKAGLCDVALVVGAEKMFFPEKREEMFRAFLGGTDVTQLDELRRSFADSEEPPPKRPPDLHSLFMDIYASMARQHMKMFGTTERQIALTAAKNHRHSVFNPLAQYRRDVTVDEVPADKVIAWPLTRAMCAPISDGAAAAVLVNETGLRKYGRGRAIEIAAIVLTSGITREANDLDRHLGRRAALAAYETAGIGPEDVDVAEVHDASAFAEIIQIENLGFCARGEGGALAEQGATSLGGRIPVNTSGGLVSKGHPIGATGLIQLHELVAQLRDEAGPRQVANARVAVAENGGGFIGVEEAATVVTVLKR